MGKPKKKTPSEEETKLYVTGDKPKSPTGTVLRNTVYQIEGQPSSLSQLESADWKVSPQLLNKHCPLSTQQEPSGSFVKIAPPTTPQPGPSGISTNPSWKRPSKMEDFADQYPQEVKRGKVPEEMAATSQTMEHAPSSPPEQDRHDSLGNIQQEQNVIPVAVEEATQPVGNASPEDSLLEGNAGADRPDQAGNGSVANVQQERTECGAPSHEALNVGDQHDLIPVFVEYDDENDIALEVLDSPIVNIRRRRNGNEPSSGGNIYFGI